MLIERLSLSRSNGSRWPSFLTTVRSRSWTRSKVVKRAPQLSHWRRRRIAAPSSLGRLILHLAVLVRAERTAHALALIDREAGAERANAGVDLGLDRAIAVDARWPGARRGRRRPCRRCRGIRPRRTRAWCPRGRADADAAGLHRRQRIERDAVLVAGDAGAFEALVGILAGEAERAQIDQREVGVGAAGDEVGAALLEAVGQGLCVAR